MSNYRVGINGHAVVDRVDVTADEYEIFVNDDGSERTLIQFSNLQQELVAEFSISKNQSFSITKM